MKQDAVVAIATFGKDEKQIYLENREILHVKYVVK